MIIYLLMRRRDVEVILYNDRILIFNHKENEEIYYKDIIDFNINGKQIRINYRDKYLNKKMTFIQFGIIEAKKRDEVFHLLRKFH
jgi:hypothetical protein